MRRDRLPAITLAAAALAGMALSPASKEDVLDTRVPPPSGHETYRELLPERIGGEAAVIRALPFAHGVLGASASYGFDASIDIVLATQAADLDAFVKDHVATRLEHYEDRASGKVDGAWSLHGHGRDGRLYGWQNHRWLFVIEARTEAVFDEVVDRFAFIERTRS